MARRDSFLTFVKLTFPRNFRHSRITKIPFIGKWAEKKFFEGDDIIVLPRDSIIPVNREAAGAGQMPLPSRILDHFIERAGFLWLMDFCICRRSNSCKDYPIDLGCLFMGEAARGINPGWGREVTAEKAKDHVRKCRDLGLMQVIGKSKLDTKWLKIGPGDKLLTVCNCCPCCCITRGIPYVSDNLAEKFARMPGVTITVREELCTGCGTCAETCYIKGIEIKEGIARVTELCRACGRCAEACPEGAIQLEIKDDNYIQSVIARIDRLVDISV